MELEGSKGSQGQASTKHGQKGLSARLCKRAGPCHTDGFIGSMLAKGPGFPHPHEGLQERRHARSNSQPRRSLFYIRKASQEHVEDEKLKPGSPTLVLGVAQRGQSQT